MTINAVAKREQVLGDLLGLTEFHRRGKRNLRPEAHMSKIVQHVSSTCTSKS